jgi:site-specific recombinase XerD
MIESYFPQATVLNRLRSGPIGPYLPGFVLTLEQRRFSPDTICRYLRGADRLGRWLQGQGIALAEANQNDLQTYVRQYARLPHTGYTQGRLSQAALSVPRIASVLREQGLFCGSVPRSTAEAWVARFDDHLVRVHGLSRYSRDNYVRYARRLIQSLQSSQPDWSRLSAIHLSDFIRREASRLKPGSCRQPVTAIRALLRFLSAEGVVAANPVFSTAAQKCLFLGQKRPESRLGSGSGGPNRL